MLYNELLSYYEKDYYPFHMPGHKRRSYNEEESILCQAHQVDITEIEDFDNLHHAEGILKAAQKRVAKLYGAEESFFLVNGSTGGLLSAISAVSVPEKKILIGRCCHKAVYHGLCVNKVTAEYVWPSYIELYDLQGQTRANDIEDILKTHAGDISAAVITSPTYDGVVSDIKQIAKIVHHYNIPLIVDEAHGAHFTFDQRFPESAVRAGADIVINSTHKTLPAMTQTALLHVRGNLINREKLKFFLQVFQTSSPSYVLMASIDACMNHLEQKGASFFEPLFVLRNKIDLASADFKKIRIVPSEIVEPGKLIIPVKNTSLTGQELYRILLEKYHIQMEMAGYNYVLGILTAMDTEAGVERLLKALQEVDELCDVDITEEYGASAGQETVDIEVQYAIHETLDKKKQWIGLEEAIGKVAGSDVMLYPPGVPLLVAGERISAAVMQQLTRALGQKMNVIGLDSKKENICVILD